MRGVYRHREPPPDGGMSEILWSDPYEGFEGSGVFFPELDEGLDAEGWAPSSRGAGLLWGPVCLVAKQGLFFP